MAKKKEQNDKQRSTYNITNKTKDKTTQTPLKTGFEFRSSGALPIIPGN
jgi:hypothetical protein